MSPLPPDHISATNVRPAIDASLARGVPEAALTRIGLDPANTDPELAIPGAVTCDHMALMAERPDLAGFLLDAANRHNLGSLGVVGLSCKTVDTLGEAFACHQRFQHLTNRTARYQSQVEGERLRLTEHRQGPPSLGSQILSDYTLLVAVRLLRLVAEAPVPVLAVHSRRARMNTTEQRTLEDFFGAPMKLGADRAALELHLSVLDMPVPSADAELAVYFRQLLDRAARFDDAPSPLVSSARVAIQDALARGTPTGAEIARRLGMSQRTLQRRLRAEDLSFAKLLAHTRSQLATGYLSDPRLSLAEVGYLLGYREDSSFFRSFRRWTGQTPSEWRSRNGHGVPERS